MTVQKEHIYRIEDTDGDGIADKSQLVVEDFNDETTDAAGGVLKHGDDLFVAIGPDLWRIKENKWGLAETKTSLSHGYGIHIGFGGHGMSGIEVGPDGRIYWQIGDIGFSGVGTNGEKYDHAILTEKNMTMLTAEWWYDLNPMEAILKCLLMAIVTHTSLCLMNTGT